MKPKGTEGISRPSVTPTIASGTVSQISTGSFTELNWITTIRTIRRIMSGKVFARPCCAKEEFSYSPPHSML